MVRAGHPMTRPADRSGTRRVLLGVAAAIAAGLLWSGLGPLAWLGRHAGRLFDGGEAGARALVATGQVPVAADLARLAGLWRNERSGAHVIVTAKGEVWSDLGALEGSALAGRTAASFAFGNGTFVCGYAVTFLSARTADWTLVSQTAGTPCPAGRFAKVPAL